MLDSIGEKGQVLSFEAARHGPSIQARRFLSILFLLSATHIFTRLITTSNYLVNDDFIMAEFMNSNFTGELESNTVFMHPIIGSVISQLNSINLNIPWFPLFIVFVQVFALSTLAILDLSRLSYIFLAFFSVAHIAFVTVAPSFTPAAIVTTSCGVALFFHAINKNLLRGAWVGALLIILGGLIRFDGMSLALLVSAIPILFIFAKRMNDDSLRLVFFAPVLSIIAGMYLIGQTQTTCKSQADCAAWNSYVNFNEIRGTFHGTDRMNLIESELENTSWSRNDYQLFRNFLYIDDKTFSLRNLERVDDVVQNPSIAQALISNPVAPLRKVLGSNPEISIFFYPAFVSFIYFFSRRILSSRSDKLFLYSGLVSWLLAAVAAATMRFPVRIHEPVTISLAIFLLVWSTTTVKKSVPSLAPLDFRRSRLDLIMLSSLLMILVGLLVLFLSKYSALNKDKIYAQNQQFKYIETNFPNSSFIVSAGVLTDVDPWTNSKSALPKQLLYLGWMTSSPHFKAKKDVLGIDNVYRGLVRNDSILFIGSEKESILIAQYIEENFESASKPKLVAELPEGNSDLLVWEFR